MPRKKKTISKIAIVSDAVGVLYFVLAMILFMAAQYTDAFSKWLGYENAGVQLIYHYIGAPAYYLLRTFLSMSISMSDTDKITMFLSVLLVILVSAVIYGAICYLILKVFTLVFLIDSE